MPGRSRPGGQAAGRISPRTFGTIGAIFGILTWLIAIGAVIILGAVAGVVWDSRTNGSQTQR